jgi:predicted dehydrogenase
MICRLGIDRFDNDLNNEKKEAIKMLNMAMIGLGWWGRTLVESVQGKSENIRFTIAANLEIPTVLDFANQYGLELTTDYKKILVDPKIDAVVIADSAGL